MLEFCKKITFSHRVNMNKSQSYLDATYSGRTDNSNTFLVSSLDKFSRLRFWYSFGNDCNRLDLVRVLKHIHYSGICRTAGSKVDNDANVLVQPKRFVRLLIHWDKNFFGLPIELTKREFTKENQS